MVKPSAKGFAWTSWCANGEVGKQGGVVRIDKEFAVIKMGTSAGRRLRKCLYILQAVLPEA